MNRRNAYALTANTISHFCVDFTCFYILFGKMAQQVSDPTVLTEGFLIYNLIAFGLQFVFGYYLDGHPKFPMGTVSIIVLTIGLIISNAWISFIIAAIGNAMFHVYGGVDSLIASKGKCSRAGIFVGSGALGVGLGTLAGKQSLFFTALAACIVSFILLFLIKPYKGKEAEYTFVKEGSFTVLLLMILLGILVRSFAGNLIDIQSLFFLSLPLCACLGKMSGGILADAFGPKRVAMLSLGLACICAIFTANNGVFSCLFVFLINITMPISLCALAGLFPKHYGLAFGLSTLALLAGTVPFFLFDMDTNMKLVGSLILLVVSFGCTYLSLKKR